MEGTPNDLEPFVEAYKLKQKEHDEMSWKENIYTMSAVSVAISKAISGKKSKAKYPNKPFSFEEREYDTKEEYISQSEIERGRKNLLMSLQVMKINFDKNHKKKEKG